MNPKTLFRSPRKTLLLGFSLLGLGWAAFAADTADESMLPVAETTKVEEDLRPMLVYKLVKFIDWPASVMGEVTDDFHVCVLGPPLMERTFSALKARPLHRRTVTVQRVELPLSETPRCHVLFIDAKVAQVAEALRQVAAMPVLTVSDQPEFAVRQGMIGLFQSQQRVGFEINLDAAKNVGLQIRAPLLELAKLVGGSR